MASRNSLQCRRGRWKYQCADETVPPRLPKEAVPKLPVQQRRCLNAGLTRNSFRLLCPSVHWERERRRSCQFLRGVRSSRRKAVYLSKSGRWLQCRQSDRDRCRSPIFRSTKRRTCPRNQGRVPGSPSAGCQAIYEYIASRLDDRRQSRHTAASRGDGTGIFTNGDERNPPIAAAGIPLPFRDRGKQQHSLIRFLS